MHQPDCCGCQLSSSQLPAWSLHCLTACCVQGRAKNIMVALEIICSAVDHYKELCEGAYCGAHPVCTLCARSRTFSDCTAEPACDAALQARGVRVYASCCFIAPAARHRAGKQVTSRRTRLSAAVCAGQSVSRVQVLHGISFSYQPPPRNIVPYAASLKGPGTRSGITSCCTSLLEDCEHLRSASCLQAMPPAALLVGRRRL